MNNNFKITKFNKRTLTINYFRKFKKESKKFYRKMLNLKNLTKIEWIILLFLKEKKIYNSVKRSVKKKCVNQLT